MKKILYLFSDTGGGHRAAANALISGVEEIAEKKVHQKMIDVFAECSDFLGAISKLYGPIIKFTPVVWGKIFSQFNSEGRIDKLIKAARPFLLKDLSKTIQSYNPDIIVSVHPLLNHIAVEARKKIGLHIPIVTVVMDPITVHKSWICPDIDLLIVATDEARETAIEFGMAKEKIRQIGIPIDPRFYEKGDKKAIRKNMKLNPDLFTILLMGGGEGAGSLFDFAKSIDSADLAAQLIVVCGKNEKVKKELEDASLSIPHKILGFSNNIPDIMDASDLIVTKAGPGAIAEAITKELPIIIISWVPGQEDGNVDFVRNRKIGFVEQDPDEAASRIKKLLDDRTFDMIKGEVRKAATPNTTTKIAKEILDQS
ncbi:MAG: glycosyltransferase [Candidatus Magasanikbacteria bacterium]